MAAPADVTGVTALPGHRLLVTFEDGRRGIYGMGPLLGRGDVSEVLKDAS